jgi:hypothetical protein
VVLGISSSMLRSRHHMPSTKCYLHCNARASGQWAKQQPASSMYLNSKLACIRPVVGKLTNIINPLLSLAAN